MAKITRNKPTAAQAEAIAAFGAAAETPAPAAPQQVAPRTPAAPQPGGKKVPRPKVTYYVTENQSGRIRAAYFAGRDKYGWRNMTDMLVDFTMQNVVRLEAELNGGEEFEPRPAGTGPVGRPVE